MANDVKSALDAAQAAAEAARLAAAAEAAKELEWLGSVKNIKEIEQGRTQFAATRLKSRYVQAFGYDRWVKLMADSR